MNKLEQVSSDDHQMSVVGSRISQGLEYTKGGQGDLSYAIMHVMLPTPSKHYLPETHLCGR